jgi:2Fe-2S ferredoxin
MAKVRFILHDGRERVVEAEVGTSVMQAAVDNNVPGILADCGGNCICGTCHGYIDPAWIDKLEPASDNEAATLEGALRVEKNSRLTCQIELKETLDGIVIRLPVSQV